MLYVWTHEVDCPAIAELTDRMNEALDGVAAAFIEASTRAPMEDPDAMRIVLRAVLTDVPYVLSTQLGILPREATCAFVTGLLRAGVGAPALDPSGSVTGTAPAGMAPSWSEQIRAELRGAADPGRAPQMQAYMKSTMPYLGVPLPATRRIARAAAAEHPPADVDDLLDRRDRPVADRRIPRGALRRNRTDRAADGGRAARAAAAVPRDDRHRRLVGPRRRGQSTDRRPAARPPVDDARR